MDILEERFNAKFAEPARYRPIYHVSGFTAPIYPVISNDNTERIQYFQWGLIPSWIKDEKGADSIKLKTLNAKAETIFEKPSFRISIRSRRCLVLVDGFFEWRHEGGQKYPYYIKMKEHVPFALAGIWDEWKNLGSGESVKSFSIITTEANALLEKIHNTKKRMPVILDRSSENRWLAPDLDEEGIKELLVPYDNNDLEVHTVSKLISSKGNNKNVPEVQEKFEYPELKKKQVKL